MIEKSTNKMQGKEQTKVLDADTKPYFFPEYNVTIEAVSQEEALEKLQTIINKK